jgi:DNA-binding CsgD family transcriptional regulator
VAGGGGRTRARDQIREITRRPLDSGALRRAVLDVLVEVLDVDGYVWLLTDPVTTVGASPIAHVPGLTPSELPALIRAKYATAANRWTTLMEATETVGLLGGALDSDDLRVSPWPALLAQFGVRDVASTVFADVFGCWGFLDLWRVGDRAPFERQDAEFLVTLAAPLTAALRESQARTFVEPAIAHRDDVGPVVLTIDDRLRIRGRTAASQSWLDTLLPPEPGAHTVPASVYNVAAQLLAVENGVDDHPASTRAHLGDGFWLTLRAARMPAVGTTDDGDDDDGSVADIVVTIEETSSSERLDLFARAFALTPREGEVLGALAAGADTRAMARAMELSVHTVQDHLKAIFAKTGAHDRVTLLSRALGTRTAGDP